jgi:hypothetical protein
MEDIDFMKYKEFVIRRELERGKWDAVIDIINYYGVKECKFIQTVSEKSETV